MSRWKWLVPAIAAVVMTAVVVPGTEAGIKWIGIDPQFKVNGQQFNVWIEWPEGYSCAVTDAIQVEVHVPRDASYEFVSESNEDVGGCGTPQTTVTSVKYTGGKHMKVFTQVGADEQFPVRVKVYLNDELIRTYMGSSRGVITGMPVQISGPGSFGPGRASLLP